MKQFFSVAACFATMLYTFTGCEKFLDKKPDKQLVVPSDIKHLQALLDNASNMNLNVNNGIGEASADNYYVTYTDWSAFTRQEYKNTYVWGDEIFFEASPNDWSNLFKVVYTANVIFDNIHNIEKISANTLQWNNVAGSAYFYRAQAFFTLITNFTKAFDPVSSSTDMGIPLRLTSDFNQPSVRSNVQQSYDQILSDLMKAAELLPVTPQHVMRPSKTAAFALLARTYLAMGQFSKAGQYADSSLQLYSTLLDYNTVNATAALPFSQFNAEVIFHAQGSHGTLQVSRAKVDSSLYQSYSTNDLRRTAFFVNNGNGTYGFKGNYTGVNSVMFVGIATDEMYLTKAECLAREGKTLEAMSTLNVLLVKRWKTGTFVPFTASDPAAALQLILTERRKQLLMRDLRWMDIKRLNKQGMNITPKRLLNGVFTELTPNENRYALPFPLITIEISGMPQNPR